MPEGIQFFCFHFLETFMNILLASSPPKTVTVLVLTVLLVWVTFTSINVCCDNKLQATA